MKKYFSILFLALFALAFSQKKWTLRECVDYAVKNNLQVINNQYNNDIQSKNLAMAKNDYLPTVSGGVNNTANFGQSQYVKTIVRNDNFSNNANIGANIYPILNEYKMIKNNIQVENNCMFRNVTAYILFLKLSKDN